MCVIEFYYLPRVVRRREASAERGWEAQRQHGDDVAEEHQPGDFGDFPRFAAHAEREQFGKAMVEAGTQHAEGDCLDREEAHLLVAEAR